MRTKGRYRIPGFSIVASATLLAAAGGAGLYALSRPIVHEPVIERDSVITDVARYGTIVRGVSATGTVASGRLTIASAQSDGTVASISVRPGSHVRPGTLLATLRSMSLESAVAEGAAQLAAARAERKSIDAQNASAILQSDAEMRTARADRDTDATQDEASRGLLKAGLIPAVTYRVARIKTLEDRDRLRMAMSRTLAAQADARARLAEQDAKIADLQSQLDARRADVASLRIVALERGTVQTISVELGQRVAAGSEIARIAGDHDLIVYLQVSEADARSIAIGQDVSLDISGTHVRGIVSHIAPSAENAGVATEISLDAPPPDLRIDSHVEGVIELARLKNVVSITRPANAADYATVNLYRVKNERATLIPVRLGTGSSDRVAVRAGLRAGDVVIVSDIPAAGGAASLRLH